MQEWIRQQLENGLPAFRGSSVQGTIRVHDGLLTELLADLLTEVRARDGARDHAGAESWPVERLARTVTRASVRAEAGALALDFEIRV